MKCCLVFINLQPCQWYQNAMCGRTLVRKKMNDHSVFLKIVAVKLDSNRILVF